MKTVPFVTLLGAALFACGGPQQSAESEPLQEPCMSAPDPVPAPAWDGHTVCHFPPGNPANAHTISVGEPAVRAHLAHGDTLGACGGGGECLPVGATCTNLECCSGLSCVTAELTPCLGAVGCTCQAALN